MGQWGDVSGRGGRERRLLAAFNAREVRGMVGQPYLNASHINPCDVHHRSFTAYRGQSTRAVMPANPTAAFPGPDVQGKRSVRHPYYKDSIGPRSAIPTIGYLALPRPDPYPFQWFAIGARYHSPNPETVYIRSLMAGGCNGDIAKHLTDEGRERGIVCV